MSSSFIFDGRDLPPVIQRAIARVMNPSLELSAAERVALAALVARAEARDGRSAFWVRRVNFGELFARAERTISTWLAALEDKGWISKEQGRTKWGSFQCLTVHLTEEAACYLGLLLNSDLSTTFRKFSAGRNRDQGKEQSFGDTSPGGADADESEARKAQPRGQVPNDCAALLGLGLKAGEIFWLMGQARKHSKRLGNVVAARWEAIHTARSPIAMIRTRLADGIDYTEVMRQRRLDQEGEDAKKMRVQAMAQAKKEYVGTEVTARNARDRVRLWPDGTASLLVWGQDRWRDAGAIAGERLLSLWEWIESERPAVVGS